jgi:ubiquinol-cytochrome c reductase cytochrome b subunit|nr:hypothetical protein [Ulva prolifera]WFS79828.1 hypothetical protein [Ulva prolifera]WFS79905.1 hypothetical protein [Ulva prolifera]
MLLIQNQKNTYDINDLKWNEWLAGVIDGDGYLTIQKNKAAVLEITMPLKDENLLNQIKQKLGGNIKRRKQSFSIRYRLGHKDGMVELINRINGNIRNTIRVKQFKTICSHFNIVYIEAKPLTAYNAYISGFFDADGTICIRVNKASKENSIKSGVFGKIERLKKARGSHQIEISIANKYFENIIIFKEAFGFGTIRKVGKDSRYETHIYTISLNNIPQFIEYTKKYPLRSSKKKRLFMLKKYFKLKSLKSYLAEENTLNYKAWVDFCYLWYDYENIKI